MRLVVPPALRVVVGKRELFENLHTKDPSVARVRHPAALARLTAVVAAARAELGGAARCVPAREVAALAGEVYREAVDAAEADPGSVEGRKASLNALLDRLQGDHGDSVHDERTFTPDTSDLVDARRFLRERGIAADDDSVARLAVAVWSARQQAAHVALRRANGDWAPDADAARFPAFVPPAPAPTSLVPVTVPAPPPPAAAPSPVGIKTDALFARYVAENPQLPKTLDKRRAALRADP